MLVLGGIFLVDNFASSHMLTIPNEHGWSLVEHSWRSKTSFSLLWHSRSTLSIFSFSTASPTLARVSFVCQQTHDWLDDKARWKIDGYVFYVLVPHLENSAVDETDGRFFAQRRRIKGVIDGCKLGSRKDYASLRGGCLLGAHYISGVCGFYHFSLREKGLGFCGEIYGSDNNKSVRSSQIKSVKL